MSSTGAVIDLTPVVERARGSSGGERALDERLGMVAARVSRTNVIAVVGPQGGTGKSRMTFAVGTALAHLAGLNVVAVDIDDDYGALKDLVPEAMRARAVWKGNGDGPVPFPQLRQFLSVTPQRLLVLDGVDSNGILDSVLASLSNADVVLLDCAGGIERPRSAWAFANADQVLVVVRFGVRVLSVV